MPLELASTDALDGSGLGVEAAGVEFSPFPRFFFEVLGSDCEGTVAAVVDIVDQS